MSEKEDEWAPKTHPVPRHWLHAEFDVCFETVSTTGKKIPQKQYQVTGLYPVIDQGSEFVGGYTDDETKVISLEEPLLVFGDHTKCIKYVTKDFAPGADGIQVLKPRGLDTKFLYFLFFSLRLPDRGYSRHFSFLKRCKFPVAPLNEQRRIVEKIEMLFADLDAGVESLTRAKARLAQYRQSILKSAFEGRLTSDLRGADADGWPMNNLGDHLRLITSGSRGWAKYYTDSGDIFVRAQNLKHDKLDLTDIAYVALPQNKTEGVRTRIYKGDVLITITGANVTKSAAVLSDLGTAYVSQHVALCRPANGLDAEFLHFFLVAEAAGRKQLKDAAYGAGKPGLNLQNIKDVVIPLPPLEEQHEVVSRLDAILSSIKTMEQQIEDGLARSKALRQSILKRAFSGQLVEQLENDEPAYLLLERIKEERQAAAKPSQRRKKANA